MAIGVGGGGDVIAQAVGEIIVRDSTSAGVNSATRNFQSLYNVVRYNWWGIQNLGHAFQGAGAVIAAGLGAAVKASVNFQQGLTQVGRTADISGAQLQDMGKALRGLALEKPIDVGALTKIAADAAALGIQGVDNIKNFTGTIADLVSTTNLTEDSAVQLARLGGVLGLQGQDWQRLGSAILFAGVNSAATEKDIVSMAVRLSGAAAAAKLTTSEVVALAATTTSLGSSSQTGATSIQRAFTQIAKAAATGKPSLEEFAKVAGYDGPKAAHNFATAFNNDAGKALAQFVTGLGKMRGNTLAVNAILQQLGFNSQRGAQTLLQLAAGTQQTVNPMLNLNKSMKLTAQAWADNTELQKQAQTVYGSTASQLKITENVAKDFAIGLGDTLLPALNAILKPVTDIIWGFDQLPTPIKEATAILGLAAAGILLIGGSILAIAPRITLITGSMLELGKVFLGVSDEAAVATLALNEMAAAQGEAANVSAFAAGMMSRSQRQVAVEAFQAATAMDVEAIAARGAAEAEVLAGQAAATMAGARRAATDAALLQAQADELVMQASLAAAEGADAEAAALLGEADAKRASAVAAEEAAQASRDLAASLYEDATAATLAAREEIAAYQAALELAAGEEGATAASYGLGIAMRTMLGPIGIVLTVITALGAYLGFFGHSAKQAADDAQALIDVDTGLVSAMRKAGAATGPLIRDFYLASQAFLTAAVAARAFGVTVNEALGVVMGTASPEKQTATWNKLSEAYANGSAKAGEAHDQLLVLRHAHDAAAEAAWLQSKNESTNATQIAKMGNAANDASSKLSDLAQAHDKINQAVLDLPGALLAEREAQLAVTDAQRALNAVQAEGAKRAEDLRKAHLDYRQALLDEKNAQDAVRAAQQAVASARDQEVRNVIDAQNKLADDTDKLYDTEDKIAELEAKIAKEREGPSVKDITAATNKLADANLALLNSQKKVGDAQYMLNYLMAEGASVRDIVDAQDQVSAARQDVADKTQAVSDAQDNLNQVQAGADPVALAKDERDLAAAQRELAGVQRDLKDDTLALNQARADLKHNTLYKQAQDDLKAAEIALAQAQLKVKDSQDAINTAQQESPAEDLTKAQLGLETALLQLAKAQVQVKKDTALMHGEQFGAGREARALSDALGALGVKASGPVLDDINKMRAGLRGAVSDINDASSAAGGFTPDFGGGGVQTPVFKKPDITPSPEPSLNADSGKQAGEGWFKGFFEYLKTHWKQLAIHILEAIAAAAVLVLAGLAAPVAIVVGGLIAAIITLIEEFGPQIAHAFEFLWNHMTSGLDSAWDAVKSWFSGKWDELTGWLKGPFVRFINWFPTEWHKLPDQLREVWNWIYTKWQGISDKIKAPFISVREWFVDKWHYLQDKMSGTHAWIADHWHELTDKLKGPFVAVHQWFADRWHDIQDKLSNLKSWVTDHWSDLKDMLTAPFSAAKDWIGTHVIDHIANMFTNLPGRIQKAMMWVGSIIKYPFVWAFDEIAKFWNATAGKLSFHTPGWLGPLIGGKGFSMPKLPILPLPALAEGGVTSGPTLAMIGEAGQEAVLPLDKMMAMFEPIDALAMEMHAVNDSLRQLVSLSEGSSAAPGGDHYEFHEVMADPADIVREITWQKKIVVR